MLNSSERMDYICDYLSAYEAKIKLANRQGLFDAAKMFELFAANICLLWFGQSFENLNSDVSNYPYVDLISHDQHIFVQVSTVQDVPRKVKSTLEKIHNSQNSRYTVLNKVVFFVLHNKSVDNVPDYVGSDQIGTIPFTKKDHLISTNDILTRAQNDFDFQCQLYELLKSDEFHASINAESFQKALDFSKDIGIKNIDCLINGEYQINRSALVDKIKVDNSRFVSIQGTAGSGKSAFCKLLLQDEELVLYARAERFLEESDINRIWSVDIEKVLQYINGRKITFFIDALEFIADCPQTKFDLLQHLYLIGQKYENVYIVTSCRTGEKGAFIKLEANLGVKTYTVDDLSEDQLAPIMEMYPVIKQMHEMKSYGALLRTPFYINLILEKQVDIDNINDEAAFREYIWENIICLQDQRKRKKYHLKSNEVVAAVERIVFDRARENLLGIRSSRIDSDILCALLSEGVLVKQGEYVRLKFDIYEDICFEQRFDANFVDCQGDYAAFYDTISQLGRCVYRRYQIWISNKLFCKIDRDKFLYNLLFADTIPANWKKQTEIGIVKSRYCASFFEEQIVRLRESGLLSDFINITNLFAFECQIEYKSDSLPKLNLYPTGHGRSALIRLVYAKKLFETDAIQMPQVMKLCIDYTKQTDTSNDTVTDAAACAIAEYYIEEILESCQGQLYSHYNLIDDIRPCLTTIYQLPSAANVWIIEFWHKMMNWYKSDSKAYARAAEDIISWTLKNVYPNLAVALTKELCQLAKLFWTFQRKNVDSLYFQDELEIEPNYGLNKNTEHYQYGNYAYPGNSFLWNLFKVKFFTGLSWAIQFVNNAILKYTNSEPEHVTKIQLYFQESGEIREYWGSGNMWLAGTEESNLPALINDIIYIVKKMAIMHITALSNDTNRRVIFANKLKKALYLQGNNIAWLTIIANIGTRFQKELPGYALDLASSITLLHLDIQRYALLHEDSTMVLLKKLILISANIPELKHRYAKDEAYDVTLQTYTINAQLYFDKNLQDQCFQMLDNLYSIVPNDKEHAVDYLQIQKMDTRAANFERINANTFSIEPRITGAASEVVHKRLEEEKPIQAALEKVQKCIDGNLSEADKTAKALTAIDTLLPLMKNPLWAIRCENILIHLIAAAIKDVSLNSEKRSELCDIWIQKGKGLLMNHSYAAKIEFFPILFQQLYSNARSEIKNELKLFMLDCLLYRGQNGMISKIAGYIKVFLEHEKELAHQFFNTIVKLSEDKMSHERYNADYLIKIGKRTEVDFVPNMIPTLLWADKYIQADGEQQVYTSQRDGIIQQYLFEGANLDVSSFDIERLDITTLCYGINCGLALDDESFCLLVKKLISCIVEVWHFNRKNNHAHKILDVYCTNEIVEFYRRQMVEASDYAECAIDLLFDEIDFFKFTKETIEFYQDIFGNFLPEFFDAYQNQERRNTCKKKIRYLEQKVAGIKSELVRIQLYSSLFLSVTRYSSMDWSQCHTDYSYEDIQFLNMQFSKYGKYHFEKMLRTIYQLRIDKLLPSILKSISVCFNTARADSNNFAKAIENERSIVQLIIYKAFIHYSDEIKRDRQLTQAYENVLEALIDLNFEDAAVLLDEFRLH